MRPFSVARRTPCDRCAVASSPAGTPRGDDREDEGCSRSRTSAMARARIRYHLPFAQTRADFRVKTIYSRGASAWPRVDGVGYVNDLTAVWDDPADRPGGGVHAHRHPRPVRPGGPGAGQARAGGEAVHPDPGAGARAVRPGRAPRVVPGVLPEPPVRFGLPDRPEGRGQRGARGPARGGDALRLLPPGGAHPPGARVLGGVGRSCTGMGCTPSIRC